MSDDPTAKILQQYQDDVAASARMAIEPSTAAPDEPPDPFDLPSTMPPGQAGSAAASAQGQAHQVRPGPHITPPSPGALPDPDDDIFRLLAQCGHLFRTARTPRADPAFARYRIRLLEARQSCLDLLDGLPDTHRDHLRRLIANIDYYLGTRPHG